MIITSAISCSRSELKVRLAMKFAAGRELIYDQTNSQTVSMNNSPLVSASTKSHGEMIQVVKSTSADGGAQIDETSTWSWSEAAADSTIRVVSESESLSYEMARNGKISGLELPADEEASRWKEYAQQNLEQSQPTFPDEPIGKGYRWTQAVKIFMPTGENLEASTTYEVSEFVEIEEHKCVVIDYRGNLILPFDVMESDSLTRRGVDRVQVSGQLTFDYENGYVYSQQEKTQVTAERAKIVGNQASANTFFIEGELSFRLKAVK